MVQTQIGDDAINPGIERALKAEAPHALVSLKERLLINVLRLMLRAGEMHRQTQHRRVVVRSEEHTSELQSPYVISYAVFCLKKTLPSPASLKARGRISLVHKLGGEAAN